MAVARRKDVVYSEDSKGAIVGGAIGRRGNIRER
jgi:hypothetical protein